MSRTYRALTVLALSGALAIGTTVVAVAAENVNDQRRALYQSQLEQNLAAADVNDQRKAYYESQLEQNLAATASAAEQARAGERSFAEVATLSAAERARAGEREFAAVAAQPVAEDQNDRLLRGIEAAAADRAQAAVEQARAGERSFDPAPIVTIAPQPVPAATDRGIDPLAILLLGLVGGLAGGAAILGGWTATNRRNRVVAA